MTRPYGRALRYMKSVFFVSSSHSTTPAASTRAASVPASDQITFHAVLNLVACSTHLVDKSLNLSLIASEEAVNSCRSVRNLSTVLDDSSNSASAIANCSVKRFDRLLKSSAQE